MDMTETELLADVSDLIEQVDLAKGPGALVWHHCFDSRRCLGNRGFPDLFIVGRRGIILAELKSANGETSAEQDLWLWFLDQTKLANYVHVWMPRDLEAGVIRAELEAIA